MKQPKEMEQVTDLFYTEISVRDKLLRASGIQNSLKIFNYCTLILP